MPVIYRIAEIAFAVNLPYMRPTWLMSVLIAFFGGVFALIATGTMKREQKTSAQAAKGAAKKTHKSSESKKEGNERQSWPWLGFITGAGALQVTALLAGMLLASVGGEFALTAQIPPAAGEMLEWDADLTKGADLHEIDLTNATGVSLIVRAEPQDAQANVLLAESGASAGTNNTLKIVGGRSTSWRGEPTSSRLLVITKTEETKPAAKAHFVAFVSRPVAHSR